MRCAFPLVTVCAALSLASACKRSEGDVACSPGTLTFSKPAIVVAEPEGTVDDVRIAAIGTDFLIVWSSGATLDDTDLYGVIVGLDGVVASNTVRITQAAGMSTRIRLAPGPGGIGVSWTDGRLTQRVAMADVLPGLAPSTSPAVFQSPVVAADQEPVPAIAAIGDAYVVAWNGRGSDGFDHLYAQVMSSSGAAVGSPFALSAAQEDRATPPTISAAVSSGGAVAVVIADEELRPGVADADVFAYLVAGTGALASARYGISSKATAPEAIGGGVVWVDRRDGGRGDLFFAQVGGGEIRLTQGPAENEAPSVTPAADGFLMTWLADGELRLRAFKGDGRANGSLLRPASGSATRADVAWTGASAGVVWAAPDGLRFRPLACP